MLCFLAMHTIKTFVLQKQWTYQVIILINTRAAKLANNK